jgi:ATP-dependent Clp endopeptidase proteolytic subunit ClpP
MFETFKLRDVPPFVLITGLINEEATAHFREDAGKVLASGQRFLPILIDSYGGDAYAMLGIRDFIKTAAKTVEVITVCHGKAMSAGACVLASGTKRFAAPGSVMMLHEISAGMFGKESEVEVNAQEINRLSKQIFDGLDDDTDHARGYWYDTISRKKMANVYMTPRQAKKHGLITDIGLPVVETIISAERKLVLK